MRGYGRLFDILAGLIALGAGLYLLGTNAAAANSIFSPLLHGLGAYMLARGIWMIRHSGTQEDMVDRLDRLIELGEATTDGRTFGRSASASNRRS